MKRTVIALVIGGLALLAPRLAAAQNREQQQTYADLRVLQQQLEQLQLAVNSLAEALKESSKSVNTKLDVQFDGVTKTLANQRLDIANLAENQRALKSKLDENNVHVGTLAQNIEDVRQAVASLKTSVLQALAPPPADGSDLIAAYTGASAPAPTTASPPPAGSPAAGSAATVPAPLHGETGREQKRLYDNAWSQYVAGQYDLAIGGFNAFLRSVAPKASYTDSAQYYIGACYQKSAKNQEAVQAFTVFLTNYKGSSMEPDGYYDRGTVYQLLGQKDKAIADFQYIISNFPDSDKKPLAEQALARIK